LLLYEKVNIFWQILVKTISCVVLTVTYS
jgi:hypothetical protein